MEITIKKTIEEKHEIKLPAYYKSRSTLFHFKIYSDANCVCVYEDEIGIKHAGLPFALDQILESTEEEFLNAYTKAKTRIDEVIKLN